MESKEIARQRVLSLIDSREPSAVCAEAKFHLKPNTVPRWRNGSLSTYMNILPEIAKEYGVTTDWLLGVESDVVVPDMLEVPVVGVIQAGYPIESFEVHDDTVSIPYDFKPSGEVYALKVKGDSMLPLVMDGDIIICEKISDRYANGRICVVTVDYESTLKKVRMDSTGISLIPLNPLYKELRFTKAEAAKHNISIHGVLVQMIRKF